MSKNFDRSIPDPVGPHKSLGCLCLIKSCKKKAVTRGACASHYEATRSRVKNGKLSESEAIENGLLLPSSKAPPAPPETISEALASLIRDRERLGDIRERLQLLRNEVDAILDL